MDNKLSTTHRILGLFYSVQNLNLLMKEKFLKIIILTVKINILGLSVRRNELVGYVNMHEYQCYWKYLDTL